MHRSSRIGKLGVFVLFVLAAALGAADARAQTWYEVRWAEARDEPPPQPVEAPLPHFTDIALKARIQGVVIARVELSAAGNVAAVELLKGLPMGLDEKTLEILPTWAFPPGEAGRLVNVFVHFATDPAPDPPEQDTPEGAARWLQRMTGLVGAGDGKCGDTCSVLAQLPKWFTDHPANLSVFETVALRDDDSAWLARLHLANQEGTDPQGYIFQEVLDEMCSRAPACLWCLGVQDALRREEPIHETFLPQHREGILYDLQSAEIFAGEEISRFQWISGGENHGLVEMYVGTSSQRWYVSRCQGHWRPVCRDMAVVVKTTCRFPVKLHDRQPPEGQVLNPPLD